MAGWQSKPAGLELISTSKGDEVRVIASASEQEKDPPSTLSARNVRGMFLSPRIYSPEIATITVRSGEI